MAATPSLTITKASARELLRYIANGKDKEAMALIAQDPDILMARPFDPADADELITDAGGNTFTDTAFQYTVWSLDKPRQDMFLNAIPLTAQGEIIRQALLQQALDQQTHFDFKPLLDAYQNYLDVYKSLPIGPAQTEWFKQTQAARTGLMLAIGKEQQRVPLSLRNEICRKDQKFGPVSPALPIREEDGLSLHIPNNIWPSEYQWDETLEGLGTKRMIMRPYSVKKEKSPLLINDCNLISEKELESDRDGIQAFQNTRSNHDLPQLLHRLATPLIPDHKHPTDETQTRVFNTLVEQKQYYKALQFAVGMQDHIKSGKLILELLSNAKELGINVNHRTDAHRRTPLHHAAINRNWHAYYAIVERGGKSFLQDASGKSAQDYRHSGGMTVFRTADQQQIRQELFGDQAPEAEAFIDQMALLQNCSQQ